MFKLINELIKLINELMADGKGGARGGQDSAGGAAGGGSRDG